MKKNKLFKQSILGVLVTLTLVSNSAQSSLLIQNWEGSGDSGFGVIALPKNDDQSSGEISFDSQGGLAFDNGVNFFGSQYDSFYVNNNGNISFSGPVGGFTPQAFPVSDQPIIAPFWADVDTDCATCGDVFIGSPNEDTLVVTWDKVGFFNENSSLTNTFQLVLIDREDTGSGNFDVEFRYDDINWTVGDASGGVDGLPPENPQEIPTAEISPELAVTISNTVAYLSAPSESTFQALDSLGLLGDEAAEAVAMQIAHAIEGIMESNPLKSALEAALVDPSILASLGEEPLLLDTVVSIQQAINSIIDEAPPELRDLITNTLSELSVNPVSLLAPAVAESPEVLIHPVLLQNPDLITGLPPQFVSDTLALLNIPFGGEGDGELLPIEFLVSLPPPSPEIANFEVAVPAQAGYDAGDGVNFYTLPGSRTAEIVNIDEADSNTGTPGIWKFAVRDGELPGSTVDNPIFPVINSETPDNYNFEFVVLEPSTPIFIDPDVAIGYDYIVNSGPNIASVILPTGFDDNMFDLYLWDNLLGEYIDSGIDLFGGTEFVFTTPVDRFRILGIDTSGMVDPTDPTVFVTGLTFDRAGLVDINQNAVTVFVDDTSINNVSAPTTLGLFALSLLMIGLHRRKLS